MNRFEVVENSSLTLGSAIVLRDKQTGVHYLLVKFMHSIGITPLLDSEGKPVISKKG